MNTIPKKIHLCWLSGDAYPRLIEYCIESWRKVMPDYEIVLWDEAKFRSEIDNRFALEALEHRKWAFAADYVRLFAIAKYGGIYMDSDVKVYKRFDKFLENGFFSCIEYYKPVNYVAIESAVMGAQPGHPFAQECLALYDGIPFVLADGTFDETTITVRMAALAARDWGFVFEPREQRLRDGVMIYAPETFTNLPGKFSRRRTYAMHICTGSWREAAKMDLKRRVGDLIKFARYSVNDPAMTLSRIGWKLKRTFFR